MMGRRRGRLQYLSALGAYSLLVRRDAVPVAHDEMEAHLPPHPPIMVMTARLWPSGMVGWTWTAVKWHQPGPARR